MKAAKLNLYAMSMAALMLSASVSMAAVSTKNDDTVNKDKGMPAEVIAPGSGNENRSDKYRVKQEVEKKQVARAAIDEKSSTSNHLMVPESVPYENSGLTGAQ